MTDTDLKTAVAEECGWEYNENKGRGWYQSPHRNKDWSYDEHKYSDDELPDFPKCLNAMHAAEETLTQDQREQFYCYLMEILPCDENHGPGPAKDGDGFEDIMLPSSFTMVHAGPRERALAFLLTKGRVDIEAVRMPDGEREGAE